MGAAVAGQAVLVADPAWRTALGSPPKGLDSRAVVLSESLTAEVAAGLESGDIEDCPGGWMVLGLDEPWRTGPDCFDAPDVWKGLGTSTAWRVVMPASATPPEGFWPLHESRPTARVSRTWTGTIDDEGLAGTAMRDIRRASEVLAARFPIDTVRPEGSTEGWRGAKQSATSSATFVFTRGTLLSGFTQAAAAEKLVVEEAWAPTDQVGVFIGDRASLKGAISVTPW